MKNDDIINESILPKPELQQNNNSKNLPSKTNNEDAKITNSKHSQQNSNNFRKRDAISKEK